jgi:hypothetical protein
LVYIVVPRCHREPVIGDLEEEWRDAVTRFGVRDARIAYWLAVLRSIGPFVWAGLKQVAKFGALASAAERIWRVVNSLL